MFATTARADSTVCPSNVGNSQPIADNVTHSTACEIGGVNNDSVTQVNLDTMFNLNNWVAFSSTYGSISGSPALPNVNATSGTIDLSGVDWTKFGSLMLVFKGGETETAPANYVGYLMEVGYNGTVSWTTPFLNTSNSTAKTTSHINAYVSPSLTPVPEPTSLLLLASAFMVIGFARKRLQRSSDSSVD
jgi:hypothetical protein